MATDRDELMALRRLAELETKAAGSSPAPAQPHRFEGGRMDQFAAYDRLSRQLPYAPEGAVGAIPGLPGDVESLGRLGLSMVSNVSRDPLLPTSTETTDKMFGEATSDDQRAGRVLGSFVAPLGAKAGAVEDAARLATQQGAAINAAKQLTSSPGGRANEIIARSLERDKLSPENAAQALQQFGDKPLTIADVAGNATQRKARLVNTLEGAGSDQMASHLFNRQSEQHARVLDDISTNLAQGGDLYGMAKRIKAERSEASKPLYEAAFNNTTPIWNNRIQQFLDDPVSQEGLRRGLKVQRLEALAEGRTFDPKAYGITDFNAAGDPIISGTPNLRLLDAVKRGLDDILEGYRDKTTGKVVLDETGRAIEKVRKSYVSELDSATANLVPEYKQARAAWSGPTQTADALNRGGDFLDMSTGQIADILKGMSPGDQEFFRIGAAQKLRDMVDNTRDNLDAVGGIFGKKATRDRIAAVFGKEAADKMAVSMGAENMMTGTKRFIGNQSASMDKAAEVAEGAGGVIQDAAKGLASGGIRGAIVRPVMNRAQEGIATYFQGMPPDVRSALAQRLTATGPEAQQTIADILSQRNTVQNARIVPGGGASVPSIDPRILAALLGGGATAKMGQQ